MKAFGSSVGQRKYVLVDMIHIKILEENVFVREICYCMMYGIQVCLRNKQKLDI